MPYLTVNYERQAFGWHSVVHIGIKVEQISSLEMLNEHYVVLQYTMKCWFRQSGTSRLPTRHMFSPVCTYGHRAEHMTRIRKKEWISNLFFLIFHKCINVNQSYNTIWFVVGFLPTGSHQGFQLSSAPKWPCQVLFLFLFIDLMFCTDEPQS